MSGMAAEVRGPREDPKRTSRRWVTIPSFRSFPRRLAIGVMCTEFAARFNASREVIRHAWLNSNPRQAELSLTVAWGSRSMSSPVMYRAFKTVGHTNEKGTHDFAV